jgi:hypothetical protein
VRDLGFEPDLIPCGAIGSGRVIGQPPHTLNCTLRSLRVRVQKQWEI